MVYIKKKIGLGWFVVGTVIGKSSSVIGGLTIGEFLDNDSYFSLRVGGGCSRTKIVFEELPSYIGNDSYYVGSNYIRCSGYNFLIGFGGYDNV